MILTNSFGAESIFPTNGCAYCPTHFFYYNGKAVGSFIKRKGSNTLWSICVRPEYQGKGLGTQMMREIVARFGKHQELTLYVYKNNTVAIRMYEKVGFVITEEYPLALDAWVMTRRAG